MLGTLCLAVYIPSSIADHWAGLLDRLRQTNVVNIDEVIDSQFPGESAARGFNVVDPYTSQASRVVLQWKASSGPEAGVCAIRFNDSNKEAYDLRSFESLTVAVESGYIVTHRGRCGSCSTLRDLAVYLGTPDLTTPARQCARRFGLSRKKQCFEHSIGLTSQCAESWAYNARHTRQECLGTCMADYGVLNLLFNRYPGAAVNDTGQLRPCLKCDEEESGPGFKYSAGRTRRNSGIESAIPRSRAEVYSVDHGSYFD